MVHAFLGRVTLNFMSELQSPKQIWLFNYKNPLLGRFGTEFFKKIPKTPGVYWMLGADKRVLYIGKAKNLQNRLRSYQQIKPDQSPRKSVRLVHLITEIVWEECESEEAALLRESYLLRTHRPPYNVLNTHPESYYLVGLKKEDRSFGFRLTNHALITDEEELYGAFKGRGIVRRGFIALLRLLWAVLAEKNHVFVADAFKYPGVLVRRNIPYAYSVVMDRSFSEEKVELWHSHIRKFLGGHSKSLLQRLTDELLEHSEIPPFMYHFIQEDLETLSSFFKYGPNRNRRLRRFHGLKTNLLPQRELDDLLIKYRLRRQKGKKQSKSSAGS
jgi:excinuclease UvrABC nuclease subunit